MLAAAVCLGLLGTATAAGPAAAGTLAVRDLEGDGPAGIDVRRVRVDNDDEVRLRVRQTDLRPKMSRHSLAVRFYLRRKRPGPEYLFTGGLGATRDWQVWRLRGRERPPAGPVDCPVRFRVDHEAERSVPVLDRSCLGDHRGRLRVKVSVTRTADDGSSTRDWVPARRSFTPWVPR